MITYDQFYSSGRAMVWAKYRSKATMGSEVFEVAENRFRSFQSQLGRRGR